MRDKWQTGTRERAPPGNGDSERLLSEFLEATPRWKFIGNGSRSRPEAA
jgi:hypothetical protein